VPESGRAAGLGGDPAAAAWNTVDSAGMAGTVADSAGSGGGPPLHAPIPPRPATSISTSSRD